ncbi:MAG: hypothetical protein GWN00_16235, partial [Aliifodinibius sp.]|nr:hypothetical protein [Fodinibius sp.]NIV12594.1 hypothetical protein [Fodinibius sp.]NIY26296.1 hypothetical protein [Fodinibius sp.]
ITPAASNPTSITPGDTVDLFFEFQVSSTTGVGQDTIIVTITGQDSLNNNSLTTSSLISWFIEEAASFTISSVNPSQSLVSRGQDSVNVGVLVRNNGGVDINLELLSLEFELKDSSNYAGELRKSFPGGILIEPDSNITVNFKVNITDTAELGPDIIDASGQASVPNMKVVLIDTSASVKGSWTVQQRPVLQYTTFVLDKDTVSTGQQNILLRFTIENSGASDTTATAGIDSVQVIVNGIANDSS